MVAPRTFGASGLQDLWTLAVAVLLSTALSVARPQSLPALTAPVNDFAHVLDQDTAQALERRIRALQTATGDAVVVATVPTFAPYGSIEEYAVRLFEQAGIGQKNKDNGALIVLALTERRVRIEVGYGLEEFITDGFAGETIRQEMLPAFRRGDYSGGLLAGATRVIQRIASARGVTLQDVPAAQPDRGPAGRIPWVPIALIIFFVIIGALRSRRASRFGRGRRGGPFFPGTWSGWSGGGGGFGGGGFGGGFGGGGFGGFGGGRSGGGGASGGW